MRPASIWAIRAIRRRWRPVRKRTPTPALMAQDWRQSLPRQSRQSASDWARLSSLVEEGADHRHRGSRIFFHDPVAGIGDDVFGHVARCSPHHRRHRGAERLLGTLDLPDMIGSTAPHPDIQKRLGTGHSKPRERAVLPGKLTATTHRLGFAGSAAQPSPMLLVTSRFSLSANALAFAGRSPSKTRAVSSRRCATSLRSAPSSTAARAATTA